MSGLHYFAFGPLRLSHITVRFTYSYIYKLCIVMQTGHIAQVFTWPTLVYRVAHLPECKFQLCLCFL